MSYTKKRCFLLLIPLIISPLIAAVILAFIYQGPVRDSSEKRFINSSSTTANFESTTVFATVYYTNTSVKVPALEPAKEE